MSRQNTLNAKYNGQRVNVINGRRSTRYGDHYLSQIGSKLFVGSAREVQRDKERAGRLGDHNGGHVICPYCSLHLYLANE